MPNEHDYYAIDTDLAALVDQVGQLRADLEIVTARHVTHRALEGLRRQTIVEVVEPGRAMKMSLRT